MTSIVYIISDIDKAIAFEWIAESLPSSKYTVSFILLNPADSDLERFLVNSGHRVTRVICATKTDWLRAFWQVKRILDKWKPDIIHCHLLTASLIGLTAARLSGVKNRIYTRHHSSQHHVYHRRGIWLDKYCNYMSTRIVAISKVVKEILINWEHVPEKKILLIPHGFRLRYFNRFNVSKVLDFRKRKEILNSRPVIGVISRFIELKGVQYIIPAFRRFNQRYPESVLLLLNAKGDYESHLQKELFQLPVNTYRCIEFEADMSAVYPAMDIFVHVPVDNHSEAFGQIYIEALAAGVPSIFTLSGIAPDFIIDGENALVVPFRDSNAIFDAMIQIWENDDLKSHLSKNGLKSVEAKFDLSLMINALDRLYQQCLVAN
jgi:glycosyltransferase involved in cell wall biosynthesis